jgi:hypothetical protein
MFDNPEKLPPIGSEEGREVSSVELVNTTGTIAVIIHRSVTPYSTYPCKLLLVTFLLSEITLSLASTKPLYFRYVYAI